MSTPIFHSCGGYRRLDAYTMANIVQLATLNFCRRFLNRTNDPCGRQYDQMTQAARSGVKNLVEGSERLKTSVSTAIQLIDVGRASLCELRDDYITWLLDHNQVPWLHSSPAASAVFALRFDPATFGDDVNHDSCAHILAQKAKFAPWLDSGDSIATANALLIIINRAIHMLDSLLQKHGENFRDEGGFHEHMAKIRMEAKQEQQHGSACGTPSCPQCGQPMRLRKGRRGEFWGCSAYPTCTGTMEVIRNNS